MSCQKEDESEYNQVFVYSLAMDSWRMIDIDTLKNLAITGLCMADISEVATQN